MRRRVAVYGATEEALQLLPLLEANPSIAIAVVFDPDPEAARSRLVAAGISPDATGLTLTDDPAIFDRPSGLDAVVDAGLSPPFAERFGAAVERGLQVVSPLTARLLWGYGYSTRDHKEELLQALNEIVQSVNLTVDPDELFARMLEIAMGVTGADRGSLMLLDDETETLRVRVAVGIEEELWPKIQLALGEGVAGWVAAQRRPLRIQGKADRERFQIVHERLDVASALCVPLLDDERLLGVLSLHHTTESSVFTEEDLAFAERLGRLDAQIIARAQEHESLRTQANRYAAVREVRAVLAGRGPLLERLHALCRRVAERAGKGIATLYLYDRDARELRVAATSLGDTSFAGEYRVRVGEGIDGAVAATREPTILHGAGGTVAYAALPLIARDQLVGVLAVQAGSNPPRGRAAEATLLEIASVVAEEVSQADREARIAARATKASAINETGIRLISARDTTEAVRLATSSAAMILEADHVVLRLQDEETRRYVIRSYFGWADGALREKLFRLDRRVCVDVLKRRSSLLVGRLSDDERWREMSNVAQSVLAAPLLHESRVIGTLALYDKVAAGHFYPSSFGKGDLQIFRRLVSYVERAVANSLFYAEARRQRSFDEETHLPNESYLVKRIDEEVARARSRGGRLAVAVCRIENLDALRRDDDGTRARRIVLRAAQALESHLRDFDVLGRTGDDTFKVLLPDPGDAPEELVYGLARAVADEVSKDDEAAEASRVALAFGYAVFPDDGADRETLLARAELPRIRML